MKTIHIDGSQELEELDKKINALKAKRAVLVREIDDKIKKLENKKNEIVKQYWLDLKKRAEGIRGLIIERA